MKITDKKYFQEYDKLIGYQIDDLINSFNFSEKEIDLNYNNLASSVYSSNIEGNTIDLNSFMNYKYNQDRFISNKEIQEIEDLNEAYQFAQNNLLNEFNILKCHEIFSKTLLIESKRGKYRTEKVGVFGSTGLVYLAIEPEFVEEKMKEFFSDINILINNELSNSEIFYYASLIHLIIAHIHPFMDGNGRAARLIEKWFLAQKLGFKFWKLSSEKYYKENREEYYKNIDLGVNFYELDYDKCIPFLLMLVRAMN